MSAPQQVPLGRRVPDRLHAVSCSLPTIEDLRGYEEKRPATLARMSSGYPRFVVHPLVRRLAEELALRHGLAGLKLWLCCSEAAARDLVTHLAVPEVVLQCFGGVFGVAHPDTTELNTRAKLFLQHTGRFLSSRQAEDELVCLGVLPAVEPETVFAGEAQAECWRQLAPLFPGTDRSDAFLTSSGMNAVYSAFQAVNELQVARGRTLWVQLGWLYLDTIAILRKFTTGPGAHVQLRRVDDREALERLFEEQGSRIAGIIAEVPSNPLIQTPDLAQLRALADRHGARLILDPSVASVYSVELLPWSDLLVCSLTKYAAHEGDVIAGLLVVNPRGADAAELRRRVAAVVAPAYARDLARLAAQLPEAPAATARMEANLQAVQRFLASRPEVGRIHWARSAGYQASFERVARGPGASGGLLSFELKVPMEVFHDHVRLAKGPSFGMRDSLLSPFIWLAHYDLVTSPEGRAELAANGIDPNLIRLSLGTEPIGELIAELAGALDAAAAVASPARP